MSESDEVKRCVDQAVQMLHERNLILEYEILVLCANVRRNRKNAEFYKEQSEFWAAECIAEQRIAGISIMFMFLVSAMAFVAIGWSVFSL